MFDRLATEKMASQIPATNTDRLAVVELNSFIRGYHAYKDVWDPFIGEKLVLRREPENVKDRSAVCVQKDGETVGHIPFNISNVVSHFLRREFNKGFAEVTGLKVNRGAGYGLEIPCIYRFYGTEPFIRKLQELFGSLRDENLL